MMNFLFNLASSSRCQLRDKEADCREKDAIISELKAKVVRLTSVVRQLEARTGELQVENMQLNEVLSARNNEINFFKSKVSGSTIVESKSRDATEARAGAESENDMEISDVDSDDSDFVACDLDEESDWASSIKKTRKKNKGVTTVPSRYLFSGTTFKSMKPETPVERAEETASAQCCTCSKLSFCKTKKCECRSLGAECGSSCGCSVSKCANRRSSKNDGEEISSSSDKAEDGDKNLDMVPEAILLLESAMKSGLEEEQDAGKQQKSRKPLGDVGNVKTEQTGDKQKQRKTWRKSKVQIVPTVVEPAGTQDPASLNSVAPPRSREDIPLRLPRAMSSTTPSENALNAPLADRNAVRSDDLSSMNKESGGVVVASRSPARLRKNPNEKENELR